MMIAEVEATLNDCPLTYVSDNLSDPEPLTPAHLLHRRWLMRLPREHVTIEDITDLEADQLRKNTKKQSILLEHFTNRWRNEYLTSLGEFIIPLEEVVNRSKWVMLCWCTMTVYASTGDYVAVGTAHPVPELSPILAASFERNS